ncbi:phage tail assembly chaperone [Paenibacillus naphthalenovorans]|uniref:phage tail assembly chaperone n=1 Tax=Paenibacillus naphthalenovorans TaxID=162209 RepID=UPI003D2AA63A
MAKQVDALQAFLTADLNIEKDVAIRRLKTSLRIKAIDSATLERAREQATNGGRKERTVDADKFKAVLVTKMVTNVDFGNDGMLTKYGAANNVDCVRKALLPGEIERIVNEGLALSGFADEDETIEEIKN